MSEKRLFLFSLLIYFVLAVAYSVVLPLAEAPDEADHYAYIRYLGLHHRLPVGPTVTQSKHPPLYHAVAAALTGWTGLDFGFLRSNPDALPLGPDKPPNFFVHTTLEEFPWRGGALAMHLARLLSVALGGITLWATWRLGRELFPEQPAIGLLAAAFLAGLPGFLFISGAINNDNAAGALGALALFLCARTLRRGPATGRSVLLGLIFGLGLLSKVSTAALWPLAALVLAGVWWLHGARPQHLVRPARHLALIWGLALLISSPWLLRNWRLYGDPLGWALVRATVDQRLEPLTWSDIGWLLRGFHRTFWGRFGAAGQVRLPGWSYVLTGILSLVLLAGVARWVVAHALGGRPRCRQVALALGIIGLAPAMVFATIVRYSAVALGTDQVRLMWPALAAIAVWTGIGVMELADWARGAVGRRKRAEGGDGMCGSGKRRGQQKEEEEIRARLVLGLSLMMAVYGVVVLLALIWPAFAPPTPIPKQDLPEGPPLAVFDGGLELLAAELPDRPLAVGQPAAIRLIWRAARPLAEDLRPAVRLVHSDGWLAAEWSHAPAGGRYATDRWRPGQAIGDDYLIAPQPRGPGEYLVQVAVRPFGGDWLPVESALAGPFVTLGQVKYQ